MTAATRAHVEWLAPAPLWDALTAATSGATNGATGGDAVGTRLRRPALLRFASDGFMDELQALLAAHPADLARLVARAETWRYPRAGLDAPAVPELADVPLRLYQPAQSRFYLVAASLACRVPGLPDHTVRAAEGERVSFVIRRVRAATNDSEANDATRSELAWVGDARGGAWRAAPHDALVDGEERLPMFPLAFTDRGTPRRLLAGFLPVARRQLYAAASDGSVGTAPAKGAPRVPRATRSAVGRAAVLLAAGRARRPTAFASTTASAPPPAPTPTLDDALLDFQRAVIDPWSAILEPVTPTPAGNTPEARADAERAAQLASALVLVDLADFLRARLPHVWRAIGGAGAPVPVTGTAASALVAALGLREHGIGFDARGRTLAEAVVAAKGIEPELERRTSLDASPFPAGYTPVRLDAEGWRLLMARAASGPPWESEEAQLPERVLKTLVRAALQEPAPADPGGVSPPTAPAPGTRPPTPAEAPGDDWYVARCVYDRPACAPGQPPLLGASTAPFHMAGFYDADAPARPIQIGLPVDTTPAAMRKYDKGVSVLLSDELRRQIKRVKGLKELMDGDIDDPDASISFGVICSLSIPIISICALILLMIMVSLLNIVFWWVPFFMLCLPVPRLKAKGAR